MRASTSSLKSKDLLGIEALLPDEIELILDTAEGFKEVSERPVKKVPALRGQLVINLFMEASTRTRVSFEIAEKRLSADTLNFTASGLAYWGNDIGGWQWLPQQHTPERPPLVDPSDARNVVGHNDDYPELITRWYQYATFMPTMRAHGMRKETEVWSYGKAAEAIIAKYLKLRYALMPYLYSLGKHTYDTGAPFMRALFMDFPDDPRVLGIGDEYMFGPAFLVAPVTEQGVVSRDVYLPAGSDWYNSARLRLIGNMTPPTRAALDGIMPARTVSEMTRA